MDRAVKPGDSFWHFVNGNWDKNTQIAADRSSAGAGVLLVDEAEGQVRAIVEDLAKDPTSPARSASRSATSTPAGWTRPRSRPPAPPPLKPYLARFAAISNRTDLFRAFAQPGVMSPIGSASCPIPADPTRYIAAAGQGGLGLPNREFYLLEGEKYDAHPQGLSRLRREDAAAGRDRRRRSQGGPDHRARDRARQGPLGAGPPARHQADLQPDEPRPARRAGPADRVAALPRGRGPGQRPRP
jgi:hypothetical protein